MRNFTEKLGFTFDVKKSIFVISCMYAYVCVIVQVPEAPNQITLLHD